MVMIVVLNDLFDFIYDSIMLQSSFFVVKCNDALMFEITPKVHFTASLPDNSLSLFGRWHGGEGGRTN